MGNHRNIEKKFSKRDHHDLIKKNAEKQINGTRSTGRGHNKHTSSPENQETTFRALRKGLEQAHNSPQKPDNTAKMKASKDKNRRITTEIQQTASTIDDPLPTETHTELKQHAQLTTVKSEKTIVATDTNGKGALTHQEQKQQKTQQAQKPIKQKSKDKKDNPEHNPTSIVGTKRKA
ncbi:hypothetical protein [Lysinibacillus fusiformis]|uniref:hypothetical protein n=1 Tax=Lysinibacillus fusiformis TaxID=28031 RepID=UPI0008F288E4|nr:hypothetical protein [Lysinibacillus fusiformis]SFS35047.1 hypothetical protein SAMN02787099_00271 [Lysinibacillus fusiformis]